MQTLKYIYIICPPFCSGGPEALHQLCDALNKLGYDAKILYTNRMNHVLQAYSKYQVKITTSLQSIDSQTSLIVLPDCFLVKQLLAHRKIYINYKKYKTCIYMLSVDNIHPCIKHASTYAEKCNIVTKYLSKNNDYVWYLCQSEYANQFLSDINLDLNKCICTDYINDIFKSETKKIRKQVKHKHVVYNPKKNFEFTKKIIDANQDINFIAIQNMRPEQVMKTMDEAMLYIDFGNHPGKDRIPREAALRDCIILTSTNGSAHNELDVPIASEFKFDINMSYEMMEKTVIEKISKALHFNIENYTSQICKQSAYKQAVLNDKIEYFKQVSLAFQLINTKIFQNENAI